MRDYEALLVCFRSEQLDAAEMQAHMIDDAEFAAYVNERLLEIRKPDIAPNQKSHLVCAGKFAV